MVRLSGEGALEIAARVWRGKDPRRLKGGRFTLGEVVDPKTGRPLTKPSSSSSAPPFLHGEDLVEFQTHGSLAVLRRVMEVLVAEGAAIPRGAGSLPFRAYMNGKLTWPRRRRSWPSLRRKGSLPGGRP